MPAEIALKELKPWKEFGETSEARAFSGTAEYCAEFTIDGKVHGGKMMLDLGRVESLAEIEVNGRNVGVLWSFPYSIDISGAVRDGVNSLKVKVTDTWFNRLVFDAGQPEDKRRTWTIAGPGKNEPLRISGLIGPVRLVAECFAR